ncbi:MAG: DUF86 domain-containing protein [Rhodospirillales bacterium]
MTGDTLYLRHILDAIARARSYTAGGRESFMATPMIQDATIRNLEIIGEAAKHVSKTFREAHPDVPWTPMTGMRDVLIHGYMGVDLETVWDVVANRMEELEKHLEKLIGDEKTQ